VSRRSRWLAVALAAAGGVVAVALGGGRWGAVGATVGAVGRAFAPSVYGWLAGRGARRQAWQGLVETVPARSCARLLDPRREIVGFVGRDGELAALTAWCEDDSAGRLRRVTGPGGVGKTRRTGRPDGGALTAAITRHGPDQQHDVNSDTTCLDVPGQCRAATRGALTIWAVISIGGALGC
jgi:hypothetical protein